jgi:hypothetical protein
MGAFDGYKWDGKIIGTRKMLDVSTSKVKFRYFNYQPSFEFYQGFELTQLCELFVQAEESNSKTVWIPSKYPNNGSVGLDTWYVKALLEEIIKEEKK